MTFAQPEFLLLLLLIPLLVWRFRRTSNERHVALQVSRLTAMQGVKTWVVYARNWLQTLRWLTMTVLIVALARPQLKWFESKIESESIDIMLAMDVSPSMLTQDFSPNRLATAMKMACDFIAQRPHDQIGLVAFSGGAFTQCPLTIDHRILQVLTNNLRVGRIKDGTAIGMGLATAANRLKDSKSKSKVIVLLTDGENNAGEIGPIRAAEIAKSLNIKVYPIGIGTDGTVNSPVQESFFGSYIFAPRTNIFNTKLLEEVANRTGGQFFRAKTSEDLHKIYDKIDQLEKTKITTTQVRRTQDLYFWILDLVYCLLLLELFLRWGPLRVITV